LTCSLTHGRDAGNGLADFSININAGVDGDLKVDVDGDDLGGNAFATVTTILEDLDGNGVNRLRTQITDGLITMITVTALTEDQSSTQNNFAQITQFRFALAASSPSVPEPSTLAMFAIGVLSVAVARRRRRP
jgi:hypothetical protein